MTQEEVALLIQGVIAKAKDYLKEGRLVPMTNEKAYPKKSRWPEFWEGYGRAVDEAEYLSVHIEPGCEADRLFKQRAPNQTPEELEYVRSNFKQTTLPIYRDYENTFRRGMHESNWSLKFDDSANGKDFEEYVNSGIDEFDSLLNYWRYAVPKPKTNDAMGVLVTMPSTYATVIKETEEGTIQVLDPSEKVAPQPIYFPVCNVWGYKYDQWYLLLRYERSEVSYGNGREKWGLVFWLIDEQTTWRITQVGKLIEWEFDIVKEFEHKVGYPPCTHLMGDHCLYEGRLQWKSPYLTVVPLLDLALMNAQYLQVSINTLMYPYRVMIGDDCDFVDAKYGISCHGTGQLTYHDERSEDPTAFRIVQCPQCKGAGTKSRISPMGALIIRPSETTAGNIGPGTIGNAMYIISPEVAAVNFVQSQIDDKEGRARKILHIEADTVMQGGTQPETATAEGLDHKASIAFRKPIIDQLFFLLDFLLDTTQKMRYGSDANLYTLNPPTNLDIRTVDDLLAELLKAREAKEPPAVIDQIIWEYLLARYGSSPELIAMFFVIMKSDRLFGITDIQISSDAAKGLADPWEVVLHNSATFIYDQLAQDKGWEKMEDDKKVEAMQTKAKEITPQQQSAQPASEAMRRLGASLAE